MEKIISTKEDFKTLPEKRNIKRGYCPLEFIPSEELVINAINENGKCFIHYHLFGRKIVVEEWDNTGNEITGSILYKLSVISNLLGIIIISSKKLLYRFTTIPKYKFEWSI